MANERTDAFTARQASDQDFLGLQRRGDEHVSFVLTEALARPDGKLYGGTALASAIAGSELVTDRPVLWSTVQFVANVVGVGDTIDMTVEVLAAGHRTSQVRIAAHAGGNLIFTALGSNALPKTDAITGVFAQMPDVPGPDECDGMALPSPPGVVRERPYRSLEMRVVRKVPGERESLIWSRVTGRPATPAVQGYVADFVPMAVINAAGRLGAGISLDNSLRSVAAVETEWVLMHLRPHATADGYANGEALLWSEDGTFLGVASQTSTAFAFD